MLLEIIFAEADACLGVAEGANFENKIVLSVASRLAVEKHMIDKIANQAFVESIASNQTPVLFGKYKELFPGNQLEISLIEQVILMTPENIHVNSFMYEPILDMSDERLKVLYGEIKKL